MESLQERKRKSSGCVADGENQLNGEYTGEKSPKISKVIEFFSRNKPWQKCINLNKLSLMETPINTEEKISKNSDEECFNSSSGISSVDSEESHADTIINEDGDKSLDQASTNTETMVLNSGEKCSANSSGFISMESDKHNEESTKSLEPNRVNTTPNKNGDRSSVEASRKIVLNSPEKCFASSSVINPVESEKHNKEPTKSLEPEDNKKSLDKELPADSSVNISVENDAHEDSLKDPDLATFGAMTKEKYSEMTEWQLNAVRHAIEIREGIAFFLRNGYFEESFIKKYKNVYEMFVEFFNTNLKQLTVIDHGIKIFDIDEKKEVVTDSLFRDDDGRIFMYFWTTTVYDITERSKNDMRTYYRCKANGHRHILEKPQNGYNMKISDSIVVRLNPYTNKAQIGTFDRVVDNATLQEMIRRCR